MILWTQPCLFQQLLFCFIFFFFTLVLCYVCDPFLSSILEALAANVEGKNACKLEIFKPKKEYAYLEILEGLNFRSVLTQPLNTNV